MKDKVILISIDGMRPDGFLNCNNPFIHEMMRRGSYTLEGSSMIPSVTLPCHMSIFHSVTPERHGMTTNTYMPMVRPVNSLFEQINHAGGRTAMYYGWEPIRDVAKPGTLKHAMLMGMLGDMDARDSYHKKAKEMAADWEKRANAGDHYMLAFGQPETWSLKYNLVWDKVFNSGLFSKEVYETEVSWYIKKMNQYGTPLDSRKDHSKSDWILWCAAMSDDKEQAHTLLKPVADYLENTSSRVPFGDYYKTVTGAHKCFVGRSVQGGIYMMMLREFISGLE